MIRYLTVADLIRINNRMTQRWGGIAGVRDQGLIEALWLVLKLATTLMSSKKQPRFAKAFFRTTRLWTGTSARLLRLRLSFLRWNGYRLQFSDREMYDWLMSFYQTGSINKSALDSWLRAHAVEA